MYQIESVEDLFVKRMAVQTISTRVGADTSTKIRALRKQKQVSCPLNQKLAILVRDMISTVSSIFAHSTNVKNSMCKYYGHVIDHANWKGHLPRCSDCREMITDPKSLRSSSHDKAGEASERWAFDAFGRWSRV